MALNWFKKKDSGSNEGPLDFSNVDSNEKAIALFNKNQLSKLFLMPLEFGGEDSPVNTLYAPQVVIDLKQRFDMMIEKLLREGKKLGYSANPEYKGKSFIPSKLNIVVTGEVEMKETIQIW